ncbi:MAG: hypothetical protein KJO07_05365, partial [Deltaproteobacteria bacterium]|nr:hypothetical protein [Deltaproteobacteria bacterium]
MSDRQPKKPEKDRRPRWRKWLKRFGITLLVVVLLVVGLVLTLTKTDFGRNQIRKQVLGAVAGYVRGSIALKSIDGDLFSDFSLRGLVIADQKGRPAISLDRLRVAYQLGGLFNQSVRVDKLHLKGLNLDLWKTSDGAVNLSTLFIPPPPDQEPQEPSAWSVLVEDLWLDKARIDLSEIVPELGVIEDLTIRGRFSLVGTNVVVELRELKARLPALEQNLDGDLQLAMTGSRVEASLRLEGQGVVVRVPTAMFISDPKILVAAVLIHADPKLVAKFAPEADLKAPVDLSVMASSAGLQELSVAVGARAGKARVSLLGRVDVEKRSVSASLALSGANGPAVTGLSPEISSKGLRVAGTVDDHARFVGYAAGLVQAFSVAEQRLDLALEGDPKRVEGKVASRGAGARLDVEGALVLVPEPKPRAEGAPAPVEEPEPILEEVSVKARVPNLGRLLGRSVPVRGSLRANVKASGPISALTVRGSAGASGFSASGTAADQLTLSFNGRGIPSAPSGSVTAEATNLRTGGQTIDQAKVSATIDASRNLSAAVAVRGKDVELSTKVGGRLEDDRLDVAIRQLAGRYQKLRARGSGGRVIARFDGNVTARDLQIEVADGSIRTTVKVTPTAAGSQISSKIDIRDIELAKLAESFGLDDDIAGQLSLNGDVELGPRRNRAQLDLDLEANYRDFPTARLGATLSLARRRLELAVDGSVGRDLAKARLRFATRTPRDPTSALAWQRQGRSRLEPSELVVGIDDLGTLGRWIPDLPFIGGSVSLRIGADESATTATFATSSMQTLYSTSNIDLRFDASVEGARFAVQGKVDGAELGVVELESKVTLPSNPLDASAWKKAPLSHVDSVEISLKRLWPSKTMWQELGIAE